MRPLTSQCKLSKSSLWLRNLRLLPTFAGVIRGLQKKKIRARPSFNKSLTNYTSEQSLINGVYDKNVFYAIFPFSKCQEPVRRERL